MKVFLKKLLLLAAFAAILRLLFAPSALEKAGAALLRLSEGESLGAVLLTAPTPAPDAAVIIGESAEPKFSPAPLKKLVLSTAAPEAGMFHNLPENDAGAPAMKNKTSYAIDVDRLLSEPLAYTLRVGTPQVLIIHTHGSEAYSQAGGAYEESDASRTTDKSKNMVQVGNVLANELAALGITVLHDTELYDHPSYSGSYSRSLAAVEEYLRKYSTVNVIIDLHRDSATLDNGEIYRTQYTTPEGESSAQVMIIAATGEAGLSFPNWEENMKLALRLQTRMDSAYPGLSRPLLVSDQRYNQHAAPGYLLVEIGTDGNTLAEAETAAKLFAGVMADVLGEIIE